MEEAFIMCRPGGQYLTMEEAQRFEFGPCRRMCSMSSSMIRLRQELKPPELKDLRAYWVMTSPTDRTAAASAPDLRRVSVKDEAAP
ncbi:hypothetical protein LTR22_024484, partial [Elasticomyces elasticus]